MKVERNVSKGNQMWMPASPWDLEVGDEFRFVSLGGLKRVVRSIIKDRETVAIGHDVYFGESAQFEVLVVHRGDPVSPGERIGRVTAEPEEVTYTVTLNHAEASGLYFGAGMLFLRDLRRGLAEAGGL